MDNILMHGDAGLVKLADFGWSCSDATDGWGRSKMCGTPEYLAPEVRFHHFISPVRSLAISRVDPCTAQNLAPHVRVRVQSA